MAAEEYLRLALQATRDGHRRRREAMLTLAIGESGPDDAWAEAARARLVADRPGHFFTSHPTVAGALADTRVTHALGRLHAQYPPTRLAWLRLGADAASGPYTGKPPESLALLTARLRLGTPTPVAASSAFREDLDAAYLTALLSIAILLADALAARGKRAA